MAKKPKKMPSRSGGRGNPAQNAAVPLNVFRARRAMGPMEAAFAQWYSGGNAPADEAALYLDVATDVAASYLEVAGGGEVTAFEPEPLAELMDTLEAADPEAMRKAMSAFHLYLDFLMETGGWTGTAEDLHACHELLVDEEVEGDDDGPVIVVPDIPAKEEADYLATVPLVQRTAALLKWIGNGKPVTGTGAMRLKDIEAAAARIGVAARGRGAEATGEADAVLGSIGNGAAATPREFVSMHDVPLLGVLWRSMGVAGMIDVTPTRALPALGATLPSEDPAVLAAWRNLIAAFLWEAFFDSLATQMWEAMYMVQASVLAAATNDEPVPIAQVRAMIDEVIAANVEYEDLDASNSPQFAAMAFDDYEQLAEMGLIELDAEVRVPRPLARSMAQALQDGFDFDIHYPSASGRGPMPGRESTPSRRSAGRTPQGSTALVYQLKIQLKGSRPPIWRRVEVASNLRLDLLHEVIQGSFEWDDSHLHAFRTGGFPGRSYARADEDFVLEDTLDESMVTLAELVTAEGQKLDYVYDFGDGWDHAITLEKILPADPAGSGRMPRCTGGRRAAPMEDSGGLGGWAWKVEAANDPTHPDHREIREWLGHLGLEDDAQIDPAAFDVEQVNETLRDQLAGW